MVISEIIGWIIKTDKNDYYTTVTYGGSYGCWTSLFDSAKIFSNKEEAISIIENDSCFNKDTKMSDGRKFPPRMIHMAAKINYKKPKGTTIISIVPLILGESVMTKKFTAEIITPKRGYDEE